MNPAERETVVTVSDADECARIYTAQKHVIARLRNDDAFTEVASGRFEGVEWAEFTIPTADWSPAGVRRKRKLSASRRAQLAEQAARLRNDDNVSSNQGENEAISDGPE